MRFPRAPLGRRHHDLGPQIARAAPGPSLPSFGRGIPMPAVNHGALEGELMKIVPIALVFGTFAALVAGASATSDRAPVLLCISSQSTRRGNSRRQSGAAPCARDPRNRAASFLHGRHHRSAHAKAARRRWVAPCYLTGAGCGSATTAGRLLSSRSARALDHSIARNHAHRAPRIR